MRDHIGAPSTHPHLKLRASQPGGLIYIHVPNERHCEMWPFDEQIDYTPNVSIVNNSPDNVRDLRGRIGFSSCKIVVPRFKSPGTSKRKVLLQVPEAFNTIAGAIGKGFSPTTQVMPGKEAGVEHSARLA